MSDGNNSGALFKNTRRTQNNHPNMTGKCVIAGVEYWISAWTKPGKNGNDPWFSLAFKETGNVIAPVQDDGLGDMLADMAAEDVEKPTRPMPRAAAIPSNKPKDTDFEDDIPY